MLSYYVLEGAKHLKHVIQMWRFPLQLFRMFTFFKAIRAFAGAHAVRILQDELPEALKRRQDQQDSRPFTKKQDVITIGRIFLGQLKISDFRSRNFRLTAMLV